MMRVVVAILTGVALEAGGLVIQKPGVPTQVTAKFEPMDTQLHSCLNDKRIVFIGPSTSKLDYLALTFFAEYGRWPDEDVVFYGEPGKFSGSGPNPLYSPVLEYGMNISGRAPPKPVGNCKAGTTQNLLWYQNNILNGHEVCDCYKVGGWEGPIDANNQTENRIYTKGSTTIAYFQWFGDVVAPRGTFSFWPLQQVPPQPVQQTCPAGQFQGSWLWSSPLQTFITTTVAHFRPTHLVVDAAFWPIEPTNTAFWEQVSLAGVAAVLSSQGKVLWRTPPLRSDYPKNKEHAGSVDKNIFLSKGWQLWDAHAAVTTLQGDNADNKELFQDSTHLNPKAQCHIMKDFLNTHVCPIWR